MASKKYVAMKQAQAIEDNAVATQQVVEMLRELLTKVDALLERQSIPDEQPKTVVKKSPSSK